MAKDGGDVKAARALHIHEEAVGGLHEALKLVLLLLGRRIGVKQVIFDIGHFRLAREGETTKQTGSS